MPKKFVVTGGAGFIGSHIADALIEKGHSVHVVDNFFTGKKEYINPGAIFHNNDICKKESLYKIFEGADGVFHAAAQAKMQLSIKDPILSHEINVTGTLNVLSVAKEVGVKRVVYSASSSAYGVKEKMPLSEDMRPEPIIPYAIQKYVGEEYCKMFYTFYDLETVSLRYFNVYGPRQSGEKDGPYATVIGIFLEQRGKGKTMTIVGDGTQRRDFVHVTDIARGNLLAMDSKSIGTGEVINLGTGKSYSILEIAKLIGGPYMFISKRPGEVFEARADNTKAKKLLLWEPKIALEKGLAMLKKEHSI